MTDEDTGCSFQATEPLRAFEAAVSELSHFGALLQSVPKLVRQLDEISPSADELLHLERHGYRDWPIVENWSEFARLTDETILCRIVDAFHIYMTEVIRLALTHEPRLLKAGAASMRVEEILDYGSIDEIVERLISRRVEELSYRGFHAIAEYVREKMGATLSIGDDDLSGATEAIALRNIIVHNRAVVNERFLEQTKRNDLTLGSRYHLLTPEVFDFIAALTNVAANVDQAIAGHFGLETAPMWPGSRPEDEAN